MTKVCVCCKKQPIPYDNTRSFHKFPNDINRLKEWMKITGITKVTKNSAVCSDHFDANAFHHTDGYTVVRRLISTAVPIANKPSTDEVTVDPSTNGTEIEYKSIITINTNEVDGHISVQSACAPGIHNNGEDYSKIEDTMVQDVPIYSYTTDGESNRKISKFIQNRHLHKSVRFKEGMQSHTMSREDFTSDTAWRKFFIYTKYKNSQVNAARQKSWRRNRKVGETEFVRCLGEDEYGAADQVPLEQEHNVIEGTENELTVCKQEDMLNTESDCVIQGEVDKMCRICLTTGVKLWNLLEHNLLEFYKNLTDLTVSSTDGYPQSVCWECAARLRSAAAVRTKAITAYDILITLISENDITNSGLVNLDRRKLRTKLSRSKLDIYSTRGEKRTRDKENFDRPEVNEVFLPENPCPIEGFDSDDDDKYLVQTNLNLMDYDHSVENSKIEEDGEMKLENNEDPVTLSNEKNKLDKIKKSKKIKELNKNVKKQPKTKQIKNVNRKINDKTYDNMFILTKLNFDQQVEEFEKRKYRQCYITSEYKCEKCYRGFDNEEQYQHHVLRHTDVMYTKTKQ